ncbi:hypothetical protein FJTKL_06926 [Diaporthe vaccinii]|uniref:Uncharacterized protein n=1 Tax=Diaporthe vaccinii TaxID=105482 RepID=A0ABR4EVW0_9PEZI
MMIRQDVYVREFGGNQEDIAYDLWSDSVSLHWVVYITGHVAGKSAFLKEGPNRPGKKAKTPVGTIKVQPVIGMRQREDKADIPPFVGERTRSNHFMMSDVLVLAPYRGNEWVQRLLMTAVIDTFTGYLPPSFFHDIFGQVIPLDALDDKPRRQWEEAYTRRVWKDSLVKVIPDALQWSGLLCMELVIPRYQWWSEAGFGFELDLDTGEWDPHDDGDSDPDPHILMLRRFEKVRESVTSPEVDLDRLSERLKKAFNIEHTHVVRPDQLIWRVRDAPLQDKAKPEAEPEHEGRGLFGSRTIPMRPLNTRPS